MWIYLLIGCSGEKTEVDCQSPTEETSFDVCFEDSWCEAWNACGFEEDCQTSKPSTTHYENGDGTMDVDCEPAGSPQDWSECMLLIESANCEELKAAAQVGTENPLWIDVCITKSCV